VQGRTWAGLRLTPPPVACWAEHGNTTSLRASWAPSPLAPPVTWLRGQAISGRPPEEIVRLGVGQVAQGRRIFPDHTAQDNLALAALRVSRGDRLSGGERQMLGIG
jgi:ABC-type branched-subunit amino acid transport system ATPase component